jgi:hypothetical protein
LSATLFAVGGAVFVLLGLVHGLYTLLDLCRPRRLVPRDPAVTRAMQSTGVRLAGDATTMWRAWIGFNLSHALGAVVFGAWAATGSAVLPALPILVAAAYLAIGWRCWFWIPNAGIAAATLCFVVAALVPH